METQNRIGLEEQEDPQRRGQGVNKSYGRDQNFNMGGGNFNVVTGPQYNVARDLVQCFNSAVSNPHKTLWDMVAGVKASHNSDLQFERGDCLPGTREAVLKDLYEWRLPETRGPPVCWLSGPAGVGKSAVALTVAKACEGDGLAGSFFFFGSDPKRNNPSALILTIAHGLVVTRPGTGRLINRRIASDPRILEASLEEQYRELIFKPLKGKKTWWSWLLELWPMSRNPSTPRHPNLVIIDGLDECSDSKTQTRVLSILFSSFAGWTTHNSPLRFLVCSRPESWIREAFESTQFRRLTKRVVLDNSFAAKKDIERYFFQSFREIRESAQYAHVDFPDPWPAQYILELLVDKSSGQFIYAVTVIRFIKNNFAHPFDQLRIILDASHSYVSRSPFHELDALYFVVLSANPDHEMLLSLLTVILLLPSSASPAFLEMLFELPPGAVSLALRAMHSVLEIQGPDDPIKVYHTSFTDFLESESRSAKFFVHRAGQRPPLIERWSSLLIQRWKDGRRSESHPKGRFPWTAWADFCLESPCEEAFRMLDRFYTIILSSCSHPQEVIAILTVVTSLPSNTPVTPEYLYQFLEYTAPQVMLALEETDWLLPVSESDNRGPMISVSHFSFTDFLHDQSRAGSFFIDKSTRCWLAGRWLRVHHQRSRESLSAKTLDLCPWYAYCSHIEAPRETILFELRRFYHDIWKNHPNQGKLASIMESIVVLSRYTQTSVELVDLIHETSQDPEVYYVLHIPSKSPNNSDSYPSFFDFLADKSRSSAPPLSDSHHDFLARRWLQVLVQMCGEPTEKYKVLLNSVSTHPDDILLIARFVLRSPGRVLWDGWADFCCDVDQPSEDLLDAFEALLSDAVVKASARIPDRFGVPIQPYPPLRWESHIGCRLFRRFDIALRWLKEKACATDINCSRELCNDISSAFL
ncbi:hypothetical protein V5O48_014030 [Marasmius crinis-equi]|uniref:Nephrocystin 3-like N-terminal domain-containing protein n=1 Tax=Marasmius crinis-equi TaxID=585013 RepID=A0ABR3EYF7_9AGAR